MYRPEGSEEEDASIGSQVRTGCDLSPRWSPRSYLVAAQMTDVELLNLGFNPSVDV